MFLQTSPWRTFPHVSYQMRNTSYFLYFPLLQFQPLSLGFSCRSAGKVLTPVRWFVCGVIRADRALGACKYQLQSGGCRAANALRHFWAGSQLFASLSSASQISRVWDTRQHIAFSHQRSIKLMISLGRGSLYCFSTPSSLLPPFNLINLFYFYADILKPKPCCWLNSPTGFRYFPDQSKLLLVGFANNIKHDSFIFHYRW